MPYWEAGTLPWTMLMANKHEEQGNPAAWASYSSKIQKLLGEVIR